MIVGDKSLIIVFLMLIEFFGGKYVGVVLWNEKVVGEDEER